MNPPGDRQGAAAPPAPPPGHRVRQGLSRRQRLVHSAQFAECYRQGRKWVGKYMVLFLREGEGASLRLGVVSSRKVGGAVQRNLARRRLREAYRKNRQGFRGEIDVVLVARRAIGEARADEVEAELIRLAGRAGLVPDGPRTGEKGEAG